MLCSPLRGAEGRTGGLSPLGGNVKVRTGGRKPGRTQGVFYDGISPVITIWLYGCRWEEITLLCEWENQSDVGTVMLRMWTVCLMHCMIK